jgi:hypothetical protein
MRATLDKNRHAAGDWGAWALIDVGLETEN